MRIIRATDTPDYPFALGSILVSLLEPAPGKAREFNRWYERDHFYAGCMTGEHFFAGRRFIATRDLKSLRFPTSSAAVADTSIGSFLALYWIEQGHHDKAQDWAVERVLELYKNNRMDNDNKRTAVHASFYQHQWACSRDDDGVPPELALDHPFGGVVMLINQRPENTSEQQRTDWLLQTQLPTMLPGSDAALCLSLTPYTLPESSPAYVPPTEGADRRSLELFFLDDAPAGNWQSSFVAFEQAQAAAGMGEVAFAAGFIPTVPGTDRYVDQT